MLQGISRKGASTMAQVAILMLATLQASCGSNDNTSPDSGSPDSGSPDAGSPDAGSPDAGSPVTSSGSLTLFPTTKVLDAPTLANLTSITDDQVTLTFSASTPLLAGIAVGDVIVAGVTTKTPVGVLRRVTAVDGLVLTTTTATLTDAIQSGHIHASGPLTSMPVGDASMSRRALPMWLSPLSPNLSVGGGTPTTGSYDINYGFTESFTDDNNYTASLNGNVGLSAGFDLDISFADGITVTLSIVGTEQGTLDFEGDSGLNVQKQATIAAFPFLPIPIPNPVMDVFPAALFLVPELDVNVGASAQLDTALTFGGTETGSVTVGAGIVDYLPTFIHSGTMTGSFNQPDLNVAAEARAYVGLVFKMNLHMQLGIIPLELFDGFAEGDGYVDIKADVTGDNKCWQVDVGLDVGGGVGFGDLTDATGVGSWSSTGNVFNKVLGTGSCGTPTTPGPWVETIPGLTGAASVALVVAGDQGTYAGATVGGGTDQGSLITRLHADGSVAWAIKDTGDQFIAAMVPAENGVIAAGQDNGIPWLMSVDQGGFDENNNPRSSTDYSPAAGGLQLVGLAATSDGNYVAIGSYLDTMSYFSMWVAKLDPSGNVIWSNTYGPGTPHGVTATADGGVVVAGEIAMTPNTDGFLLRLGSDGSITWFNTVGDGRLAAVTPVLTGGFAATGANSEGYGWILTVDDSGTIGFSGTYYDGVSGTYGIDHFGKAIVDTGDGLLIAGELTNLNGGNPGDLWLLKMGYDQSIIFSRQYGGTEEDSGNSLVMLTDQSFVVGGDSASLGTSPQPWLLHLPHDGSITFTAASGATTEDDTGNYQANDSTGVGPLTAAPMALPLTTTASTTALTSITLAPVSLN